MKQNYLRIRIGLRTIKTALAVMLAMIVVDAYGTTSSKLILAMLGAMDAVQPSFKDSLRACLVQIVGVVLGALLGVLLQMLPGDHVISAGLGLVAVITLYNTLGVRFSPGLPCMIIVIISTTPDITPAYYAIGRIWDSMIGLGVGMAVNTLVFPYDNSQRIRQAVESLDRELIRFLEELFDGDDERPDEGIMAQKVNDIGRQLDIFTRQWAPLHRRRHARNRERFAVCAGKARELLARIEVLSRMEALGRLNEENRARLTACGADIRDQRPLDAVLERDVVTNYHVRQILQLRRELLEQLKK